MTNREKYAEQLIDIALESNDVAVSNNGEVCMCTCLQCSDCIGNASIRSCRELIKEWSEQEYGEPTVDWSKVPVDAKILVRDSEDEPWKRRHFARCDKNKICAWSVGSTSHSSDGYNDVTGWKYAKLAEEDV